MKRNIFWGIKKTIAKMMIVTVLATSVCTNVALFRTESVFAASAWSSTQVYNGGDQVEYNGSIYEARYWTQGDIPGVNEVWTLISQGTGGSEAPTSSGGDLSGGNATVVLDPKVGTNVYGVKLPANYYDKKVVGYFPNYAIGNDAHVDFDIADLQWDKLTHVQYAFGIVNKETYKLEAGDIKNDIENKFEGRSFIHKGQEIKMDESLGYYGQFNIMHTLKKMYPDVTVLISTGGWGASEGLWYATLNENAMRTFSASAIEFIRKYGFDGIDIDFEFPSETAQSGNYSEYIESIRPGIADRYVKFIKILSEDLAKASKEDGKYYWLTSAVSASSWVLGGQTNSDFLDYLDFVSIMSYDYHGGWNNYVENQANLYPDPADTETANVAVKTLGFNWSYRFYRGKVQSEKLLMGVPYYTRGWTNVSGGTNGLHGSSGTPLTNATDGLNRWYDEDANGNETPAGANPLWHVMNVMQKNSNYKKYWDDIGKVPHIWNATNNTFLTFEDTQSVQERINFVNSNNLGGVLIWVMHGDYDYDSAKGEYVIGDTLTTMFYDQFKAAGASQVTSDIDITNKTLNFDVDFGGKYDHPNYTYSIKVTNKTGASIPAGFTLSFYVPKSTEFTSFWGGSFSTRDVDNSFTEVTLISNQGIEANGTVEFTGMMKCCFSAAKNFKLNGYSMLSEVNAEIERLNRSYITKENGSTENPTDKPTEKPTDPVVTPEEVVGVVANAGINTVAVTWNSNASMEAKGQLYNVYLDGVKKLSNVSCATYSISNVSAGNHTVKVTSVLNGYETSGVSKTVTVKDPVVNTNVTLKINGYQISTTAEGYRTVYTIDDPDKEVVKAGLIYGLDDYSTHSELIINSPNSNVYAYEATEAGKVDLFTTATAQSYAMTMKFSSSVSFYTMQVNVRAYAQLKDGTYVYSDIRSCKVYDLADKLYKDNMMNTYASHNYLYDNILKLVNPSYAKVPFDWNNTLVNIK